MTPVSERLSGAPLLVFDGSGSPLRVRSAGDELSKGARGVNRTHVIGVVVAMAALAAGCGGDDDSDAEAVTTSGGAVEAAVVTEAVTATTSAAAAVTTTTQVVEATLPSGSSISTAGLGPVQIGASVGAAEAAVGVTFTPAVSSTDGTCIEYAIPGLDGVGVIAVDGAVAVVEVSTPIVATPSGVVVGDPAGRPADLFGARIETTEVGGNVVHTFVPVDDDDQAYRVVFVTDGSVVYRILAGRTPEVTSLQGCAG